MNEERKQIINYLLKIMNDYIEGYGEDRHPVPEFYVIEEAIKDVERMSKVEMLINMDNELHNRTIKLSELKKAIGL